MILVEFENPHYKEQTVSLWREAFGDSEEYIRFFHSMHGRCVCITVGEGDELVSALYLIDGELCGEKGYYLFAAATFKKFRGRGYMAKLLNKAKDFALRNGKSFIALVPAEQSLFGYYSRFGYKTAFYAKKQLVCEKIDRSDCNVFAWCNEHIEYIKCEHDRFGTDIFESDGTIYSVFGGSYIKTPAEKSEEYKYGMLLSLSENADKLTQLNSYIGMTME